MNERLMKMIKEIEKKIKNNEYILIVCEGEEQVGMSTMGLSFAQYSWGKKNE